MAAVAAADQIAIANKDELAASPRGRCEGEEDQRCTITVPAPAQRCVGRHPFLGHQQLVECKRAGNSLKMRRRSEISG